MANLNTKYHSYTYPDLKITLKRFFCNVADEVGTVGYWREHIDQMYAQMPFPTLWENLEVEIWNMGHPDLISSTKATLLDYNLSTPGYQVAVGLYFGHERIAIGVFPDGWSSTNSTNYTTITQQKRDYSRRALSHEIGHWYFDQAGFFSRSNYIQIQLSNLWESLRPHQADGDNSHEDGAEVYRALFGADEVRGTFSDNKPYQPSEQLRTLVRCGYWLNGNLSSKAVSNFKLHSTWCEWTETVNKPIWGWLPFYSVERYALTSNWQKFVYKNNGWVVC